MKIELENIIPVIPVQDISKSIEFYTNKLGFKVDRGNSVSDSISQVSRDGHRIMLSEHMDIGSPACVWIGLKTDNLFHEFKDQGVLIILEPQNRPWAYEMKVKDLDGNILWLGTSPKKIGVHQIDLDFM